MERPLFDVLAYGYPGRGTNNRPFGWSSCAVVRSGGHNMMIDAGSYSSRRPIINGLKELGLEPKDIDIVLLTHLHHDHIQNIDLFPRAEFYLSEKEWTFALTTSDMPYQKPILVPLLFYKKHFLEDNEEIAPGVTALSTPGHTPGSMSFLVETEEKIVFTGDAIKNRLELCTASVDMTYDYPASHASIQRIIAASDRVLMGHDGIFSTRDGVFRQITQTRMDLSFRDGFTCNNGELTVSAVLDEAVGEPKDFVY